MTHAEFIANVLPLHDDMYRLASAMCGSADDASDAVQETMMKLWKARNGIPSGDVATPAYCMKALKANTITLLSRRRHNETLEDRLNDTDADSRLELDDTQRTLTRIIDSLPENQRIVMRLIAVEGCDYTTAAKLTGFSETNVRKLLSRARKHIREVFTLLNS